LAKEKAPQREALLEGLVLYGDYLVTAENLAYLFGCEVEVKE
jgi:hypothetical protein